MLLGEQFVRDRVVQVLRGQVLRGKEQLGAGGGGRRIFCGR